MLPFPEILWDSKVRHACVEADFCLLVDENHWTGKNNIEHVSTKWIARNPRAMSLKGFEL
jgi:hypothetical protein